MNREFLVSLVVLVNLACALGAKSIFSNWFIASGTIWCGAGSLADSCDELGEYAETDKCCREHDMCPYAYHGNQPESNGYKTSFLYTMSHCECDKIFHDCLNEKPYKENSYVIWESYQSIGVKCFAYMPCSSNDDSQAGDSVVRSLWAKISSREMGNCSNNTRVVVFDDIFEYDEYVKSNLVVAELSRMSHMLSKNHQAYYNQKRKNHQCSVLFTNFTRKILNYFESSYMKNHAISQMAADLIKFSNESKWFSQWSGGENQMFNTMPMLLILTFTLGLLAAAIALIVIKVRSSKRYIQVELK